MQRVRAEADSDDKAVKGDALEQLVVQLFEAIPGVRCVGTKVLDALGAHEIDLFFGNEQERNGLSRICRTY